MSGMNSIIYISQQARPLTELDLRDILTTSRRNNAANHLSGMLLFCNGCLMQYLEGEELVLNQTYEKISRDKRHRDLVVLSRQPVTEREFANWEMAYSDISQPQFDELTSASWLFDASTGLSRGQRLLRSFWQNNTPRTLGD